MFQCELALSSLLVLSKPPQSPLDILDPGPLETRADAATTVPDAAISNRSRTVIARIFAPTAATTWQQFYVNFTSQVDGLHAQRLTDLRAVLGAASWRYAESLIRAGAEDRDPEFTAADYVRSRIGSYTVSSHIPAPASNIQLGIIHRASVPGLNAAWPIWRAAFIVSDPYSGTASGEAVGSNLLRPTTGHWRTPNRHPAVP